MFLARKHLLISFFVDSTAVILSAPICFYICEFGIIILENHHNCSCFEGNYPELT